nr:hypothetical protein [Ferrimicrobium acidiphilum]
MKKIFVQDGVATIDNTSLQVFGETNATPFQEALSMPSDANINVGLVDRTTGTSQLKPCVSFFGCLKGKKDGSWTCTISVRGRKQRYMAVAQTARLFRFTFGSDGNSEEAASGKIYLGIDRSNYEIGGKPLLDEYVRAGVLDSDSMLDAELFKKIGRAFNGYVAPKLIGMTIKKSESFMIFVLPSRSAVTYIGVDDSSNISVAGLDAFGNQIGYYPSKPTSTAKFVSFDDSAFTLNMANGADFYNGLFVGADSHRKVEIPSGLIERISGFDWLFANMEDPCMEFKSKGAGVYAKLWAAREAMPRGNQLVRKANLKVVCFRKSQSKIEVLIDENLTTDTLGWLAREKPIPLAFENTFIRTYGKSTYWSDYITIVQALMTRRPVNRSWALKIATSKLNSKKMEWLSSLSEYQHANDFYNESEFCFRTLNIYENSRSVNSEAFAEATGRIAGKFVSFKKTKNNNKSTFDILTYSKYDRDKLRFVLQRIALSINLARAGDEDVTEMDQFIKANQPKDEVPDIEAHSDLSYFFYRGVFKELS